jgi:hypothetical protein
MQAPPPPPIGPEQAALLAGRLSLVVASRDAALRPHLVRALGCRLEPGARELTVLLSLDAAAPVLADLQANGRISLVCSQPSTHRTLQFKGDDAHRVPLTAADEALAAEHAHRFGEEIGTLGFAPELVQTMLAHEAGMAAVRFTVAEVFEQTPGPRAGSRLDVRAERPDA